MNMSNKSCSESPERRRLLREIGKLDFIILELNLYLDTHPLDQQALDKYRRFMLIKNQLCNEYAEKFGPLTLNGTGTDTREWKWATQDWPWEGGYY